MADIEYCPRCHRGVLYLTADDEQSEQLQCFNCHFGTSRVKEGFEVKAPGEPITAIEGEK